MDLHPPDHYTEERLTDMGDADLDLLIAGIGSLEPEEEERYRAVLDRAVELISHRRER